MLNDKLIRLINRQEKAITSAENALLEGLTPIEKKLFRAVKGQLNKMNKTGGKFDFDEKNTNLVNELDQILIGEIQNSSYPGDVRDFLQNFDTVTDFQSELHQNLNDISPEELRNLVDPFKQQIVQDTLNGLTGSGVAVEFVEPVRQELFKNIVAGANSSDVEQILRTMIEGDSDRLGDLRRYVGQVTRDSLNQYEGQINASISEKYGLDAFEYVGSLVEDSRSQCRSWVNKRVLTKEELPSLISSAYSSGQGMIPGTTAENFAVFRGGYNCRHSAIPFRLTKREKERLEQEQQEEIDDQDAEREKNIQEVERSVEDGKKRIEQSEKKIKVKKSELNDGLFLSKRSKDINEAAIDVLQDNDGAIDVANEYNTVITLRNSTEGSVNGSRAFLKDLGRYPDLTPYNIGVYKRGVEGFCAVDNSYYSVKILKKDVILPVSETKATGIGTKNALSPTLEDLEEFGKKPGYLYSKQKKALYKKAGGSKYYEQAKMTKEGKVKFWGISEAHNVTRKKNNVTPTITHESGHLIQNNTIRADVFAIQAEN